MKNTVARHVTECSFFRQAPPQFRMILLT